MATFVDGEQSWQTGDKWPRLGVLATLDKTTTPHFQMQTKYGNLYLYQLVIKNPNTTDPLDPQRFAAVARALLWSVTILDPNGHNLDLPVPVIQKLFLETVAQTGPLIRKILGKP